LFRTQILNYFGFAAQIAQYLPSTATYGSRFMA